MTTGIMPHAVQRRPSAHPSAIPEGIRGHNPTTTNKAGSNGATVAFKVATAAEEESTVRRSGRASRPSAKVLENNERQEAAQEVELAKASSSANGKRKQSDSVVNDGTKTSRRRVQFLPDEGDDDDDDDDATSL